jgi:hypothetical protein
MSPQVALGLILDGLRTNFWGVGCPPYCVQPSYGLLLALFLLGWLFGVACAVFVVLRFGGLLCALVPAAPCAGSSTVAPLSRSQLLASYLHEQNHIANSRRRGLICLGVSLWIFVPCLPLLAVLLTCFGTSLCTSSLDLLLPLRPPLNWCLTRVLWNLCVLLLLIS